MQWLKQNLDILTNVLDFNPEVPEQVQSAGTFGVDTVAEDGHGNLVAMTTNLKRVIMRDCKTDPDAHVALSSCYW